MCVAVFGVVTIEWIEWIVTERYKCNWGGYGASCRYCWGKWMVTVFLDFEKVF